MKLLLLGSKEYPFGTAVGDEIPSGGIERYTENLVRELRRCEDISTLIITRLFPGLPKEEKKESIEVYRVPWIRGFYLRNPSFNLLAFFKALTLKFDIILSQGPVASFLGSILAILKKKKLIATPAGVAYVQPQYRGMIRKLIYLLEKIAYRRADAVVFLSAAEKEQFKRKLGYLPRRYLIIPTGVEVPKISKEETEKITEELNIRRSIVITFVGRLIEVKGAEIFIQALKDIKADFKAVIVGDGPEREKLENMVEKHRLEDKVIFTGWRNDVPAILAVSDIFVLPSYSEGLPIALLEAMMAGKACIVTDIGLPVENRKDALIVKAGNINELRKVLEELLENEKLRKKLGENAKKKVRNEFSWEKAAESYIKLFKNLSS
jgi:glycosyltransferase involved in cell wall biosynthesis